MVPSLAMPALTATSAMGVGVEATRAALHARRGGLAPCDLPGMPPGIWVGRVPGLEEVALPAELARFDCRNNRLAELALRQDGFEAAVREAAGRFGAHRVAVVLGTSTAGIAETEAAYARRAEDGTLPGDFDFAHTHDLHALPRYVRARLGLRGPVVSISTACTSGARSFLEAGALIAAGVCDAAVVGGVDTLCRMTLHGFNALELLSKAACRPCAADRDGISIGEAAGFALLMRPEDAAPGAPLLLGTGASADGHHMSSPHPEGLGAVAAMRAALEAAGGEPVDYINLHGTGTRANDAMEGVAVRALFGDSVPCSSTKGWTGHTLGASGALEAVIAAICVADGLVPGCLGLEAGDPAFGVDVATENRARPVRRVLSNSFGFGGSNCALVIGRA
ncbi:beta-ketoacyl-[acyl-carrier-protein] synthase family protein [Roseomonas indoligenes]|uniref:Beta-ketoacyl-[acyl-carrier-protein] synthase family protein n=1 Tax=Roseomonas indoligenes TaxID=2820811 RepID=A0A940N451_9PROT|nr:beta-ketoacyl-[acyl-carrier-protein] synthase family protein [Pararoseomonas indoligenes]MBP0495646.1 beta-ketoacyl-[acyl-carrier-protein] synthase family protein [Pararoseomonas indoligenes]